LRIERANSGLLSSGLSCSMILSTRLGAVSGDLGVRNECASLVTRCQAIEYGISVSLDRRVTDLLGILSMVSGAFGAFRRSAIEGVGGHDVGSAKMPISP